MGDRSWKLGVSSPEASDQSSYPLTVNCYSRQRRGSAHAVNKWMVPIIEPRFFLVIRTTV